MKTNLISRSSLLALLLVVLLFSSPLATLAQQISAAAQAKLDAEADVNKFLWINVGFVSFPCIMGGASVGCSRGDPWSQDIHYGSGAFGAICCGSIPFISTYNQKKPTPPPARLLGKSPEYVDVYTDVYKDRTLKLRLQYAAVGCGIGGVVWAGAALIALAVDE